MQNLDMVYP